MMEYIFNLADFLASGAGFATGVTRIQDFLQNGGRAPCFAQLLNAIFRDRTLHGGSDSERATLP